MNRKTVSVKQIVSMFEGVYADCPSDHIFRNVEMTADADTETGIVTIKLNGMWFTKQSLIDMFQLLESAEDCLEVIKPKEVVEQVNS